MKDLRDRVAFVTGGASGIGLGIAQALVGAGGKVVIADIRSDHIDAALERFAAAGTRDRVDGIVLDVTDRSAMAAAAAHTERRFGKVHVLVNNAGVGIEGPLRRATFDDWDFGLGVNLGGVVNGIQTFLPRIRAHGEGGHVVNTASLAGLVWMPSFMAIYATSKAAVITLSECMRDDLAPDHIGVSVLCPGPVKSNIHESGRNRPEKYRGSSGFTQAEESLARRKVSALWMEPEVVGEKVLAAIREAMPKEVNPDLIQSLRERR